MDKISIIIPVYNVESYIRKCLESVINQTYKNLEIICVNDGSTDKSGQICDEYAVKDQRIKVIHKKNGGVSSAQNEGLRIFTGDYVGFVDSDDWVKPNYYEKMYNLMINSKVDIACAGFYKGEQGDFIKLKNKRKIKRGILYKEDVLRYIFERDKYPAFAGYRWNKLFDSKFFRPISEGGYNIRADEELDVGEDIVMVVECVLKSEGAVYCNDAYYYYLVRSESLFHSDNIEKRKGSLEAYGYVIKKLYNKNIKRGIIIWVKRFYVYHASLLAEIALKNNDKSNLIIMQREISRYLKEYIETNRMYPERIERINYLLDADIQ